MYRLTGRRAKSNANSAARRDFWHSILERITITHYEKGFNNPKEFDIHFRT